jgi:monoamine oxidase
MFMKTLVIGAGMAGLSAARVIDDAGHDVTVIEAKDRLGGRTFTNSDIAPFPVEFGAEFIHGDKVITWELIKRAELNTAQWHKQDDALVQLEPEQATQLGEAHLTMKDAQARLADFEVTRTWGLPDEAVNKGESWHDYLTRVGFTDSQMRYVERSFANSVSDSSARFDAEEALASALNETDGRMDFRILEGYKTLVNFVAEGLDIRLNQPVQRIEWQTASKQAESVTVHTHNDILSADNVVIAVPLGVLKAGSMRFVPELPEVKLEALNHLRMGIVIKLVYVFSEAILPDTTSAVYSRQNPPMWWTSNYGRAPQQQQVWTAFASGDWARELLANAHEQGTDTMMLDALKSLEQATGKTLPTPTTMRLVNWLADPYTQGGYSYATPGHASARQDLAQATPPLFWAGEATAPWHQTATVHGAIVSGRRAAQEVLASRPAEVS